mgnify:CR=1 FL=1
MIPIKTESAWKGTSDCRNCGIRDMVLFADLKEEDFKHIHSPIDDLEFAPGDTLLHMGEPANSLMTLRVGMVKLVRNTVDGRQRIVRVLRDRKCLKIFHYARFDLAVLRLALGVRVGPVYCTKIASKLTRTYTDKHGLKDLVRELTGAEISKQQQSSDWGAAHLTEAQLAYAASDVLFLHELKARLDALLAREGRSELAAACFGFLPTRARLDLMGWAQSDIFSHRDRPADD